ncbi:hypothetical protein ACQ4M4_28355 [Leptolyngbya sp. AN02str]|uniref:hypothetical protein n=1 Tax=Leptolyngbya sp. AN02str TaxID=3423363 RepID=UPI003D321063
MSYQHQLSPWVIHQLLPNLTRITIARFRNRAEAEGYMRVMGQLKPLARFAIAFDTPVSASAASVPTVTPSVAIAATRQRRTSKTVAQ